jgi:threonine 3-dehydrogenase
MMNLITGGMGFIGSHLARQLVKAGEAVILLDISTRSHLVDDIKNRVKIVQGDLDNWSMVMETVKKNNVDCIYHCGALLSAAAEESPLATFKVNANGAFHILEAARLFDVKNVIFLSTIATYGPGLRPRVTDDDLQKPISMYGVTKVFGERLGEYYQSKFGVNFRGLRLPSAIGPGRGPGGVSAYSSLIVQEPAAGRRYDVYVGKSTKIPLIYIKDTVAAMISLARADERQLTRRVYNVEGFSPTAGELADTVKSLLAEAHVDFHPQEEMVRIADSWPKELDGSCAERDWGFKSQYMLDGAVKDFIEEFQARRHLYE